MFSKTASPLPHFTLTLASLLTPTLASAQGEVGKTDPSQPTQASKQADNSTAPTTLPEILLLSSTPDTVSLPERIMALAVERGANPEEIKYKDGQWLICSEASCSLLAKANEQETASYSKSLEIKGLRIGDELAITGHKYAQVRIDRGPDYGIPGLGNFKTQDDGSITFIPDPSFKGSVTKAAPSRLTGATEVATGAEVLERDYSREALSLVRDRILTELDTTFVLIISVPSKCGPCREYKKDVRQAAKRYSADSKVTFITINFESFEEARNVMGSIRLFPTSVFFPALPDYMEVRFENGTGWQERPFLDGIERPGLQSEGRLMQGPLREQISKTTGIRAGLRGIKQTLKELLK